MKDIFISYSKEDKAVAKKLVSKLETTGYSCSIHPRDTVTQTVDSKESIKNSISEAKIFIFLLSKYYENSSESFFQIECAVDNNLRIIPFKVDKVSENFPIKYILHTMEWVDAFGDGFDEAFDVLLEIITETFGGKIPEKKSKSKEIKQLSNSKKNVNSNILTIIFAVLAVIFALLYLTSDKNNTENNNSVVKNDINNATNINNAPVVSKINDKSLSADEKFLVGKWKITDYSDSRNITGSDKVETLKNIENLKKVAFLVFSDNRSFSRIGFTEKPQEGKWEFDVANKTINLQAVNSNFVEKVNLLEYSEAKIVIVVVENVSDNNNKTEQVTTKITFEKI